VQLESAIDDCDQTASKSENAIARIRVIGVRFEHRAAISNSFHLVRFGSLALPCLDDSSAINGMMKVLYLHAFRTFIPSFLVIQCDNTDFKPTYPFNGSFLLTTGISIIYRSQTWIE